MSTIKPLFAYVVLEREKLKSASIIIPDIADKRLAPSCGVVIAVGEMCYEPVKKLVGKLVLFKQHAGAWVKTPDGKELFCVEEVDLLGEIKEQSK